MRLRKEEVEIIKECFYDNFKEGSIYLFGSRVDDSLKGGDIDLFVIPSNEISIRESKRKFLVELKTLIGDQKIDVIISRDKTRLIEQEALSKGILL